MSACMNGSLPKLFMTSRAVLMTALHEVESNLVSLKSYKPIAGEAIGLLYS